MKRTISTVHVLAGLVIAGVVFCWWDYARYESENRRLFVDAGQLLNQVTQLKSENFRTNSDRCVQLDQLRLSYLALSSRNNPSLNPITASLVAGKLAVIDNMIGRIRSDIETLNAACT